MINVGDTSLNNFAAEIHENAVNHGWWDKERELPEVLMLCVSELAEALEEYRAGRPMVWYAANCDCTTCANRPVMHNEICEGCECNENYKPEGIAVEMADCIIRILDYCSHEGIDIEKIIQLKNNYNKTRPYRHGGKKC